MTNTDKKLTLFTVPNIITLLNMFSGCMAIFAVMRENDLKRAFYFIVACAVLDFFDGFLARLLNQYSAIGKELDSLADVVSFGVAPAVILFSMHESMGGGQWWGYSVFILALFSALRLAKFNVDPTQEREFKGLPTPASAMFVGSAGYLMASGVYTVEPQYIIGISILLAYFLICNTPMFSLKFSGLGIKGNKIRFGFILCSAIALVLWFISAIPFIILAYIAISVGRQISNYV